MLFQGGIHPPPTVGRAGRRILVVCHPTVHVVKLDPARVIAPLDHASRSALLRVTGNDAVSPTRVFSWRSGAGTSSTYVLTLDQYGEPVTITAP